MLVFIDFINYLILIVGIIMNNENIDEYFLDKSK